MIPRVPLLLLLFPVCLHLGFSTEPFSHRLTGQSLLQSLQFFRALGGLLHSLYALGIVVILMVRPHDVVAPTEGGGEIVHESHVVEVVVISTSPEGEDMLERPREIVSAVSVNGLEETEDDPDVHGEDVKVSGAKDVENRTGDRPSTEDEDFSWMGVLSSKSEGSRVLVVNFVDVFVHGTPVEGLMGEEMEHVFVNEEERDLECDIFPSGEGNLPGAHSETLGNWVEQPNQGELYGEMRKKYALRALPLVLS